MTPSCPRCRTPLREEDRAEGRFLACEDCGGTAALLPVLRERLRPDVAGALWNGPREERTSAPLPCPQCGTGMRVTVLAAMGGLKPIDLCAACRLAWFDRGELEALARRAPRPDAAPPGLEERRAWVRLKMEEQRDAGIVPVGAWSRETFTGAAGLPLLIGDEETDRRPWVTWALAGAILLVQAVMGIKHGMETWVLGPSIGGDVERLLHEWGFVPARPWRHGGLTPLTAFFLHTSLVHVLVNAWFLVLAGQPLERRIGPWRTLLLVAAAAYAGSLGDLVVRSGEAQPAVGASGGIAGLFAACALGLPRLRLGFTLGWHRTQAEATITQIRVGVAWVFALWFALELIGAGWVSRASGSLGAKVSHGSHVGGALAGASLWWFWLRAVLAAGTASQGTRDPGGA